MSPVNVRSPDILAIRLSLLEKRLDTALYETHSLGFFNTSVSSASGLPGRG